MKCLYCGKEIESKLDAFISDENYPKLRMGEECDVYCSEECFNKSKTK